MPNETLRRTVQYDFNSDKNNIDFTQYTDNVCASPAERVFTNPSQDTKLHMCSLNSSSMNYRFSNATSPTFIIISGDALCQLAARYFATSLLHYMRWKAESVKLYVAGPLPDTHMVPSYATEPVIWKEHLQRAIECALTYFDSCNVLGFAATPVALLYVDIHSTTNALPSLLNMLPQEREFLIRVVCFSGAVDNQPSVPTSNTCGYVQVTLPLQKVSITRQPHSVVNSRVICYLNAMLPRLEHICSCEPLHGLPQSTLQSCAPLFFTRHGQSEYNLQDRLGGDPELTAGGRKDANDLAEFFASQVASNDKLFAQCSSTWRESVGFEVWCSQLRRTQHTARPIATALPGSSMKTFKSLNEIHAGICELMTNEEIESIYPNISQFRRHDKVGFRYPNGESYRDLLARLTPLLISLVNMPTCVVVVAHQAVLRTMLSFFGGPSVEEAVHIPCPQRTVWVCTYNRLGEPQLSQITLPTRTARSHSPLLHHKNSMCNTCTSSFDNEVGTGQTTELVKWRQEENNKNKKEEDELNSEHCNEQVMFEDDTCKWTGWEAAF